MPRPSVARAVSRAAGDEPSARAVAEYPEWITGLRLERDELLGGSRPGLVGMVRRSALSTGVVPLRVHPRDAPAGPSDRRSRGDDPVEPLQWPWTWRASSGRHTCAASRLRYGAAGRPGTHDGEPRRDSDGRREPKAASGPDAVSERSESCSAARWEPLSFSGNSRINPYQHSPRCHGRKAMPCHTWSTRKRGPLMTAQVSRAGDGDKET